MTVHAGGAGAEVQRDGDVAAPTEVPRTVGCAQLLVGAADEVGSPLAQGDQVAHEVQRRVRVVTLLGDVDGARVAER